MLLNKQKEEGRVKLTYRAMKKNILVHSRMENTIMTKFRSGSNGYLLRTSSWRLLPYTAVLLTGLVSTLPSTVRAQVYDSLEVEKSDNAAQIHPPNTPRVTASTAQTAVSEPSQAAASTTPTVSVTTYHYNNRRNGWNNAEAVLTPASVGSSQFSLLHSVPLDEQIDAQPLVLTAQTIAGGTHDVVYVATENDTIYAIDATSGAVLLTRNFGSPVPMSALPGQCNNNSTVIGINSTPVIDPVTRTMYVITYTLESGVPIFRLHGLDPSTLKDLYTPQTVSASQTLSNGSTYSFKAYAARQRAALLVANGNVYAGFASFCDYKSDVARGWILGWKANSLAPLSHNHLADRLATSPNNYFLSSIWMSGYGLVAEGSSNLYFVTGNSDNSGTSYNTANTARNLSESVVRVSADLSTVQQYFTPSDVAGLEQADTDLGSGGVMTLPTQPGSVPYLAVAAGKDGRMFLMNRTNLGGYTAGGPNKVVGTFPIGNCWCGPSYFGGSDGVGRVVSSGGDQIKVWKIHTSPSTTLVQENASAQLPHGIQDQGSFTTISSNGTQASTAVIWTVRRPTENTTKAVTLYAFDASTGTTLTSQTAGTWPNLTGNANIVPVVANGMVYVASYKQLAIFGIGAPGATIASPAAPVVAVAASRVSGTVVALNNGSFTILPRNGKPVVVRSTGADQLRQAVPFVVGDNVEVQGSFDTAGELQSTAIAHAKQPEAWSQDQGQQ